MSKPENAIKVGPVQASVFLNDGQQGTYRTATVHRRYRDEQGDWQSSDSYNLVQLLALRQAADLAINHILAQEATEPVETEHATA